MKWVGWCAAVCVCVYVCHGGPCYAVLVCVITALSTEPKLSKVRLNSAQLSFAAQGQTRDSVSAGRDREGSSGGL